MSIAKINPVARENFYRVIGAIPQSEASWEARQQTLRDWRLDPQFEPYWPTIDQMLGDDFGSFRTRVAALQSAGPWEDYDYDAWREQREYDRQHAEDHLP